MLVDRSIAGLVLHFRTPKRTLACLHSLADEGIRHVVVVDNSEDDGMSIRAMALGLAGLKTVGLQVDLLQPKQNVGFGAGVALGIRHILQTTQAHLLLVNSDALLARGALSHMLNLLPQHGVIVPRLASRAGQQGHGAFMYYRRLTALLTKRPPRGEAVAIPSGCCLLIRQDQLRTDLFDTDFFFYGEDIMLGFNLAQRGVKVAEATEATVIHAGSASSKNGSMFYEYHMARAHWLLAGKVANNGLEQCFFIIGRCLTLPLRACVRSMRSRTLTPWRGLVAATTDVLRGRCRSFTPPVSRV